MRYAAVALAVAIFLDVSRASAADAQRLVVHEWGTFTCLQDETGNAIGGINTDDEPVPGFVHRIGNLINASNELTGYYQGIPEGHPCVTMRLETPVIYFHRAPGSAPGPVSVDVAFKGGWLTEFYPDATFTAPGIVDNGANPFNGDHSYTYGAITADTVGALKWPAVQVGAAGKGPDTDLKVWTSPRLARSDSVTVGGESEKFLFYRGVGHLDAPLRVQRIGAGDQIQIDLKARLKKNIAAALAHSPMWLVRVGPDGSVDWRRGYVPPHGPPGRDVLGEMDTNFAADDYHPTGLASLRKDMASFLVKAGLFPDEAEAMLKTWEVSYFKSPGLRLFFLVPQPWTDAVLPLHISGNPPTVRVMVGRIEILSPAQEKLVKQIETSTPSGPGIIVSTPHGMMDADDVRQRLDAGEPMSRFADDLPPDQKAYLLLGRFRDALLIHEQATHPNPDLAKFIAKQGIEVQKVH